MFRWSVASISLGVRKKCGKRVRNQIGSLGKLAGLYMALQSGWNWERPLMEALGAAGVFYE